MMRCGVFRSVAVALAISVVTAGHLSHAEGLDILGLQLGMAEPQVNALLLRQGISGDRITRTISPCQTRRGCDVIVTARTVDGELTISLGVDRNDPPMSLVVARIDYTLKGRRSGEPQMIQSSVLGRFGIPDQVNPMTWCPGVSMGGSCRPDHPSLSFLPQTLTLTLKAGSRDSVAK